MRLARSVVLLSACSASAWSIKHVSMQRSASDLHWHIPRNPPVTVPNVRSNDTCATLPVTGALTTMHVMEA